MSLILCRQGDNKTLNDFTNIVEYCTAPVKTKDSCFTFTFGCITDDSLSEMIAVKKINGKSGGRQYTHTIICPTPAYKPVSDEEYMEMAKEIGKHYYDLGYQSVVSVHFDTDIRHIHILVNTVSFFSRRKFSQSISQLNRFKFHCNRILEKYGFDIVKTPTEKLEDHKTYSFSDGYDFLEAYDEIAKDIAISFVDDIEAPGLVTNIPSKKKYNPDVPKHGFNRFFASESETYRDYYKPRENPGYKKFDVSRAWAPENELVSMSEFDSANTLPVITVIDNVPGSNCFYDRTDASEGTGMYVDAGRTIEILVPKSVDPKDIHSIINRIPPHSPKEKLDAIRESTNAQAALFNSGNEIPVTVDIQDRIFVRYNNNESEPTTGMVSYHISECISDDISTSAYKSKPRREFMFKALAEFKSVFKSAKPLSSYGPPFILKDTFSENIDIDSETIFDDSENFTNKPE